MTRNERVAAFVDRANLAIDGQIAQHYRVAARAVSGEQCVDSVVDRLRHAFAHRDHALANFRSVYRQAFLVPAHVLPDTRFRGRPLLTLDGLCGGVALVHDDALPFVAEDPVQILLDAAFGLARRVHEERPGDGITVVDGGFHRRCYALTVRSLDAGHVHFRRGVSEAAVADGTWRLGDQVHHVFRAVHVA